MATSSLFSESNFSSDSRVTDTQSLTQRQAFKRFCHTIRQLSPVEFEAISGLAETLHRLAHPAPTPGARQDEAQNPKTRETPIISIGPSGLGGRYQKEF